jgi:hypothetical protein
MIITTRVVEICFALIGDLPKNPASRLGFCVSDTYQIAEMAEAIS